MRILVQGRRSCSSSCYNATGDKCVCCCGGRNHGVGLEAALEKNEDLLPEYARDYLRESRTQMQLVFE